MQQHNENLTVVKGSPDVLFSILCRLDKYNFASTDPDRIYFDYHTHEPDLIVYSYGCLPDKIIRDVSLTMMSKIKTEVTYNNNHAQASLIEYKNGMTYDCGVKTTKI